MEADNKMMDTAFIFPGQGSQEPGMLQDMAEEFPRIRATFDEASEALGYDLHQLVMEGPAEKLNQTEFTQPALLTASLAVWRVWRDEGGDMPFAVAGHSLGEYSALVAAGVLEFRDAVLLVQKRGQFMQAAVPLGEGGMAAILGLPDEVVEEVCAEQSRPGELVEPANYNAPGQLVISGHKPALERALVALKERGARRALPLDVSAPFHSELMAPAAEKMRAPLNEVTFRPPEMKLVQNVDAELHHEPEDIREQLVAQMMQAVLWTGCIGRLMAEGVTNLVECGPGRVLSGLNKRIAKELSATAMNSRDSLREFLQQSREPGA